MLGPESRLRSCLEEVLAKEIDGEVVVINLASGTYYSAEGVGSLVWSTIEGGLPLSEVAAEVAARYDVGLEQARDDVLAFAAELLREGLMVAAEEAAMPAARTPAQGAAKLPYEPPQIHAYRDMEDLLALDPPTPGLSDLRWKQ